MQYLPSGEGALAHRLQRRTAYKIQNGRQGAPKWPTGLERCLPCLSLNEFFDPRTPSMRKGRDGGKNGGQKGGGRKRLLIIVATTSLPAVDRRLLERSTL